MANYQYMMSADDVARELNCSKSHAYKLVKSMNEELASQGYITMAGRIPRAYWAKKMYGYELSVGQERRAVWHEVLGGIAPKANKLEQAKRMLRELAETSNAVQSNEIFDMAEEQGISKRTLENAKKELCIRARKINNSWYWELDKIKQI